MAASESHDDSNLEFDERPVPRAEDPLQFSMADLLILTAMASALFGMQYWLPLGIHAGLLGIITLLALLVSAFFDVRRSLFRLGWWVLLIAYLATSAAAIIRGWHE